MKPSTNALFAALLAAATATMLLAACSQTRSGVVEAPMMLVDGSAVSVVASAAPVVDAGAGLGDLRTGDHYIGTYTCSQGNTTMDLAIDAASAGPDGKDAVVAVFAFDFNGGDEHKGSFRMNGTLDPRSRTLKLEPDEWIEEVDGWVMVGLHGTLSRGGKALSGSIDGPGCSTFSVVRKPSAEH